jgi:hypothetical protein
MIKINHRIPFQRIISIRWRQKNAEVPDLIHDIAIMSSVNNGNLALVIYLGKGRYGEKKDAE